MDTTVSDSLVAPMLDGACRLPQWGVIRAVGADAATFLHGQLSNDVKLQSPQQARMAAFCTAQGRMLASFVYAKRGAEEIWLACSADVLPPTLKRLSMFVMRAKVRLTDASQELAAVGLLGPTATHAMGGDDVPVWAKRDLGDAADPTAAMVIRLPDANGVARALWLGPPDQAQALLQGAPASAPEVWSWLEVNSAVVPVVAATSGQFVPQMLNYEVVGGVDFKKGCYPGQEVVARSQYLGKLKRRAFLLASPQPAQAGQELFTAADPAQPAGLVAAAAPVPTGLGTGWLLLAESKIAALDAPGGLHLGAADGPALSLLPLPYRLPHEESGH